MVPAKVGNYAQVVEGIDWGGTQIVCVFACLISSIII